MSENVNLSELQQIVSVSLDLIEKLQNENAEIKRNLSDCVTSIRDIQEISSRRYGSLEQVVLKQSCKIAYLKNREKIALSKSENNENHTLPFAGKGVVYSVVTGDYDRINEVVFRNPDLSYIMFTDNPHLKSDTWEIRHLDSEGGLDKVRLSRKPKILAHEFLPDFDYSIYVDANILIRGDLREFVHRYRGKQPFLCFPHYSQDCIYDEAMACISLNKDDPDVITSHVDFLRKQGYPAHNGLIAGTFMVRDHNDPRVRSVMNTWWDMVLNYSRRDQLSFNYACWKHNFLYDLADLFVFDNEYIVITEGHGKR